MRGGEVVCIIMMAMMDGLEHANTLKFSGRGEKLRVREWWVVG